MWALAAAGLAYAAACALLYANQRGLMYAPTPPTAAAADAVFLSSDGERLKVWRVGAGGDGNADGGNGAADGDGGGHGDANGDGGGHGDAALIYFGGNAEDVALNIPGFTAAFPRHTIYLANYRGYGGSSGAPSEAALFADALALYDHARARHAAVTVVGRSLGSAVAAHLAAERPVRKLALVTPFDSAVNLGRQMFPIFPVALLIKDRYDTAARAPVIAEQVAAAASTDTVGASVLVIIAARDRIVPRRRSDALVAALTAALPADRLTVTTIPHAGHNNLDADPAYLNTLAAFVNG